MTIHAAGGGGIRGVSLRESIKVLKQFGTPPENLWPSETPRFEQLPTRPELFSFARDFESFQYFRLDSWYLEVTDRINLMRAWLISGNPFLLGFAVPASVHINHSAAIVF